VSRVTDPRNLCLIGLPPADLLDEVAAAWAAQGYDVDECFRRATKVSEEWSYEPAANPKAATRNVAKRLTKATEEERRVPVRLKTVAQIMNPQPHTAAVLHRLLDWIDRADRAAQAGLRKPAFETPEGKPIFPPDGEEWWLTEMERRQREWAEEESESSGPEAESANETESDADEEDSDDEELWRTKKATGTEEGTGHAGEKSPWGSTGTAGATEEKSPGAQAGAAGAKKDDAEGRSGKTVAPTADVGPGMRNLGNTCFLAAVTRARLMCGEAWQQLLRGAGEDRTTTARRHTLDLLCALRGAGPRSAGGGRAPYSPRPFWRWLRAACPTFNNTRQHDAAEFLSHWQQKLRETPDALETSGAWHQWRTEADAVPITYIKCGACKRTRDNRNLQNREPNGVWTAFIRPDGNYAGVADALRQDAQDTARDWVCDGDEGCGRRSKMQKWLKYETLPPVVAVLLKRHADVGGLKISSARVPIEPEIDLREHWEPKPERKAPPSNGVEEEATAVPEGTTYRVRAVVEHVGESIHSGHYRCWVREHPPGGGGSGGNWTLYDDSTVVPGRAELPPGVETGAYIIFYEKSPGACAEPTAGEAAGAAPGVQANADGTTDLLTDEEAWGGSDADPGSAPPSPCIVDLTGGAPAEGVGEAAGETRGGEIQGDEIWGGEVQCDADGDVVMEDAE